ncbi:MAG: hypothetical protein IPL19_01340 [Sandaracinaceae bacterium]|nr:hypothetical protein [Sandaracinaceae bacterium]
MPTPRLTIPLFLLFASACGGPSEPTTTSTAAATAQESSGSEGAPVVAPSVEPEASAPRVSTTEAWLPVVAHGGPIRRVVRDATGRYALARSDDGVVSFYDLATRAPRVVVQVGGRRGQGDVDLLAIAPDGLRAVAGTTDGSGQSALVLIDLPSGETINFVPRNERLSASWMDTDPAIRQVFVLARDYEADDTAYRVTVYEVDGRVRCQSEALSLRLPWNRPRGFVSRSGDAVVIAGEDRTFAIDSATCRVAELEPGSVPNPAAEGSTLVTEPAAILVPQRGETVVEQANGAPATGASERAVVKVVSFTARRSLVITTDASAIEWTAAGARVLRCGAGATRGVEVAGRAILIAPRALCDVAEDRALGDGAVPAALDDDGRLAVVASTRPNGTAETLLVELPSFRVIARAGALRDFTADPDEHRAVFTSDAAFVALETVDGMVVVATASGQRVRHRLPAVATLVGTDGERSAFVYRPSGERYGGEYRLFDPREPMAPPQPVDSAANYRVMTSFDVGCPDGVDVLVDLRTLQSIELGPCAPMRRAYVHVGEGSAFALFHDSVVELRDATGTDRVVLRSVITPPAEGTNDAATAFPFAHDTLGRSYFSGSEPSVRVRRAGDARTAELRTPRADPALLETLGRLLGAP